MLGVLPEYRNPGLGRALKMQQKEDALARGIDLIEWTFDPLDMKNAYFNIERLGAIVRRYVRNQYGVSSSILHGGLPTDRCVAEWWIRKGAREGGGRGADRGAAGHPGGARQTGRDRESVRRMLCAGPDGDSAWKRSVISAGNAAVKIERIVLRQIRLPLVHFFETSFSRTYEREIIIVEVESEGLSGWGEITAGEHPFYNEEWTAAAWIIARDYVAPRVIGREIGDAGEVDALSRHIRGHNMARGGVEAAVWDLQARRNGNPLWKEIGGGARREIPCGVSIGIQDSVEQLIGKIESELAAGYQRIKMKIKPGWDIEVVRRIRERFPAIQLMADANSAYTLADAARLKQLDDFHLMMIEQPLAHDDIIDHAALQAQIETPICLDECIRSAHHAEQAIAMKAGRIINIKLGRVGGFARIEAAARCVRSARGFRCGAAACWRRGSGGRTTLHFRRCRISRCRAMCPRAIVTGSATSLCLQVEITPAGTIAIRDEPGFGYEIDLDFVRSVTVREDER